MTRKIPKTYFRQATNQGYIRQSRPHIGILMQMGTCISLPGEALRDGNVRGILDRLTNMAIKKIESGWERFSLDDYFKEAGRVVAMNSVAEHYSFYSGWKIVPLKERVKQDLERISANLYETGMDGKRKILSTAKDKLAYRIGLTIPENAFYYDPETCKKSGDPWCGMVVSKSSRV